MFNVSNPSFKGELIFTTALTEQEFANIPKKKIEKIKENRKNLQKFVGDEANFSKGDVVEITLTTKSREAKNLMDRDLTDEDEIIEEGTYILNDENSDDEVLEAVFIPDPKPEEKGKVKDKVLYKYHYMPSPESAENGAGEMPEKVANINNIEKKIKKLAKKIKEDIKEYPEKMKERKEKIKDYNKLFLNKKNQEGEC